METGQTIDNQISPQLRTSYDSAHRALWVRWNPTPRPCINIDLLKEYSCFIRSVGEGNGYYYHAGRAYPLEYVVMAHDEETAGSL